MQLEVVSCLKKKNLFILKQIENTPAGMQPTWQWLIGSPRVCSWNIKYIKDLKIPNSITISFHDLYSCLNILHIFPLNICFVLIFRKCFFTPLLLLCVRCVWVKCCFIGMWKNLANVEVGIETRHLRTTEATLQEFSSSPKRLRYPIFVGVDSKTCTKYLCIKLQSQLKASERFLLWS